MTPNRKLITEPPRGLYHWARIFNRLQRNFFQDDLELRREKQVIDFLILNGYQKVYILKDTDLFQNLNGLEEVKNLDAAEIVVITDQNFSRNPCPEIINQIKNILQKQKHLYLCLNRHYVNIDNSYHDTLLDNEFTLAITQWLKKELQYAQVIDLSLDYIDRGRSFTWVIPDRHYFIKQL